MAKFHSGTMAIPTGTVDVSVTGLSLDFNPLIASVNVRQPTATADIITAYVVGAPSRTGFSVVLSAPPAVSGYYLDYTLFETPGITPVAGDTLAVSYDDLQDVVARFLGYNSDSLTTAQTSEVDGYIQSGIRNFYYPPKSEMVDENFEWSFIRQMGSVITLAGTSSYSLPDGFGRIAGQIVVAGDNGPSIPIIPYGDIMGMRQRVVSGRPRFAAVIPKQSFGTRGQGKSLELYPSPDGVYALSFRCDADTGKIDKDNNPFPLGGAMFSELIKESCLAVAEQMANDEEGLHTRKFNELLASSIARDRKSSAQDFGDIGDPEARAYCDFHPLATRGFLY